MKKTTFTEREINAMKSLRETTTIKAIAEAFGTSETTVSYNEPIKKSTRSSA